MINIYNKLRAKAIFFGLKITPIRLKSYKDILTECLKSFDKVKYEESFYEVLISNVCFNNDLNEINDEITSILLKKFDFSLDKKQNKNLKTIQYNLIYNSLFKKLTFKEYEENLINQMYFQSALNMLTIQEIKFLKDTENEWLRLQFKKFNFLELNYDYNNFNEYLTYIRENKQNINNFELKLNFLNNYEFILNNLKFKNLLNNELKEDNSFKLNNLEY